MESNANRADGFYKYLVLVGLIVAVSSAGLATWSVQRGQERVFALEAEVAATSADAALQQADIRVVQSYLDGVNTRARAATDRSTPHYRLLEDEAGKATRRVELAQLAMKAKTDVAVVKSGQMTILSNQRKHDILLGGIVAGGGLVFTMTGLLLWYWRVQRYREIETQ